MVVGRVTDVRPAVRTACATAPLTLPEPAFTSGAEAVALLKRREAVSASCKACRDTPSAATVAKRALPDPHGRARQVAGKRWVVDLNARQEATLQLSSVNLPGGVQVRALRAGRSRAAPIPAAAVAPCGSMSRRPSQTAPP